MLSGVLRAPSEDEATWRIELAVLAGVLNFSALAQHRDPKSTPDPGVDGGRGGPVWRNPVFQAVSVRPGREDFLRRCRQRPTDPQHRSRSAGVLHFESLSGWFPRCCSDRKASRASRRSSQKTLYVAIQSAASLRGSGVSESQWSRPLTARWTSPALSRTFRCFETALREMSKRLAISVTRNVVFARWARMDRREGSASAAYVVPSRGAEYSTIRLNG